MSTTKSPSIASRCRGLGLEPRAELPAGDSPRISENTTASWTRRRRAGVGGGRLLGWRRPFARPLARRCPSPRGSRSDRAPSARNAEAGEERRGTGARPTPFGWHSFRTQYAEVGPAVDPVERIEPHVPRNAPLARSTTTNAYSASFAQACSVLRTHSAVSIRWYPVRTTPSTARARRATLDRGEDVVDVALGRRSEQHGPVGSSRGCHRAVV